MKKILVLILFSPVFLLAQSKPNIVFILTDDMGYGEISRNNNTYSTPTIDSLANNGAYFSRFYVRTVCTPTRIAALTGNYPFRFQGNLEYSVQQPYDTVHIPRDTITLPEALKEEGYTTLHLGKWHVGQNVPESLPNGVGFDKYFGGIISYASLKPQEEDFIGIDVSSYNYEPIVTTKFLTDQLTDTAVTWIAEQAKDNSAPFFMYYAFTNPHDHASVFGGGDTIPYKPSDYALAPGGYTDAQKQKWASIKNIDDNVKRIVDTLAALGIDSNTIVIYTHDNGADQSNAPVNNPFSGYKQDLREGGVRVPMIWYHPGTIDSMVIDSLCAITDIYPTIIEGVLESSVRNSPDGINFYPLLTGGTVPIRYYIGGWVENRAWSVYKGSMWKLVNNKSAFLANPATLPDDIELFNMQTDGGETTDVSGSNASVVSELQAIITGETVQPIRTLGSFTTPPSGWDYNPPYWGYPPMFYLNGYLYKISQIDKQ